MRQYFNCHAWLTIRSISKIKKIDNGNAVANNNNMSTLTSSIDGELILMQHANEYAPALQLACLVDNEINDNEFADNKINNDNNDNNYITKDKIDNDRITNKITKEKITEDKIDDNKITKEINKDTIDNNKTTNEITKDKINNNNNEIINDITNNKIDNNNDNIIKDEITNDEINNNKITKDEIDDNKTSSVPDNKDTDSFIDELINNINRLFISVELHITLGLVYKTTSVPDDKDTDSGDASKVETNCSLSKATTKDPTKDDIATTERKEVVTYKLNWANNLYLTFTSLFKCFSTTNTYSYLPP